MRLDEEQKLISIRTYTNAFELQFLGSNAKSLLFDWITLFILTELIVIFLGQVYPINLLYQWTFQENWFFIQFVFIPILTPILLLSLLKRDGMSFWRYIAAVINDSLSEHVFEPFNETPFWRFWARKER